MLLYFRRFINKLSILDVNIESSILEAEMKSINSMDKYAIAAIRGGHLVRHLKKGASAEFAKTILFFLKCDENNICWVEVNLGNGD